MRELRERKRLIEALEDARDYTLAAYAHLDERGRSFPYVRTVNPPLWELAHVAWFQEHWCLRWQDGAPRKPSLLDDADAMLNSALIAHRARWDLPRLTWPVVNDYLQRVLDATIGSIERADERFDPYFPTLALYHEDMHAEAYLMSLQTLALPAPARASPQTLPPPAALDRTRASFAGGAFVLGAAPGEDFVFDNELQPHAVSIAPFELATATVTQGEYREFVEAGGYSDPRWWSEAGWTWRSEAGVECPRHWRREDGSWLARSFDAWAPIAESLAMLHVNAHEAEAYAAWRGARLPTEAEWEHAARWGLAEGEDRFPWGGGLEGASPANLDLAVGQVVDPRALPQTDSRAGVRQMLGNVWEWTATPFGPYPGFDPGPYKEYSQPWFGDHRVLRGGSCATRSRLVSTRWRNFYTPERTDAFAGIRLAWSVPG
jgi:iron(II)-dependent oxidoreductase